MIRYESGLFGFNVLFRLHGSALFKSFSPAIMSSIVYLFLYHFDASSIEDDRIMLHPYPMGALISALTFLLSFRANFAYNRYWEAFTAIHQMHSKWIDVGMELAAFHLQAAKYNSRKPPSYGNHPETDFVERERQRFQEQSLQALQEQLELEEIENQNLMSLRTKWHTVLTRSRSRSNINQQQQQTEQKSKKTKQKSPMSLTAARKSGVKMIGNPASKTFSSTNSALVTRSQKYKAWDTQDGPSPFLEEAAHLLSLMSAVAMSTLRGDVSSAASPLITFKPGDPFPHVDPDSYNADVRKEWNQSRRSVAVLSYIFGLNRTAQYRTLYNAARPFRVVGGVSDAEIELLKAARGPQAKVALCSMWLQEFISREYLAGSLGTVAPPILSRLYQFTSDGLLGYHQARKISYIPFPFPHAQITSFFVLVVVGFMPVLMIGFVTNLVCGFLLNLLTVMCFTGLHEVARELENPFHNTPNDIPLNNFQGQFNEALMSMFAGYHPDAYWDIQNATSNNNNKGNDETLKLSAVKEEDHSD